MDPILVLIVMFFLAIATIIGLGGILIGTYSLWRHYRSEDELKSQLLTSLDREVFQEQVKTLWQTAITLILSGIALILISGYVFISVIQRQ